MDPNEPTRNLGVTVEWDKNERQRARNRINQRNYRRRKSEQAKESENKRGKSASKSPAPSLNVPELPEFNPEDTGLPPLKREHSANSFQYGFQNSPWQLPTTDPNQPTDLMMIPPAILDPGSSSTRETPESGGRPEDWRMANTYATHPDIPLLSSQIQNFTWSGSPVPEASTRRSETPSTASSRGKTTLHLAAENGHSQCIRVLLYHGADPNLTDADGNTPLHVAAEGGHTEVVSTLIEGGCNINATTLSGRTALHLAAQNNRYEVVDQLLRAGCDPNIQISER